MKKKHNKKNKIEKTSLTRSAAYSEARLGDWEHCVRKAFYNDILNEHCKNLRSIAFNYGTPQGFYMWIQCDIIGAYYFNKPLPYRYSGRTVIFE